jgi:hypothetical protein
MGDGVLCERFSKRSIATGKDDASGRVPVVTE